MTRRVYATAMVAFLLALGCSSDVKRRRLLFEKRTYTDSQGKVLPYRLLKPDNYNPGTKYPLVLFLHGIGERGDDNDEQLAHSVVEFATEANRKAYPCFVLAPQCPLDSKWIAWKPDTQQVPEHSEALPLVVELLDSLPKEWSIDPQRVYVTGLSMGGSGTWDLLIRRPDLFAAAVPVCGGGDQTQAARIASIPVWAFHGAEDEDMYPCLSRTMINALKKAGGKPKYTEYAGVGHDSWRYAYKDAEMFRWLFAQKRQ